VHALHALQAARPSFVRLPEALKNFVLISKPVKDNGSWSRCWLLVTGCWLLVASCWLLVTGCELLVTGCELLVTGCELLVTGCVLVASCWLLVASCGLRVVAHTAYCLLITDHRTLTPEP